MKAQANTTPGLDRIRGWATAIAWVLGLVVVAPAALILAAYGTTQYAFSAGLPIWLAWLLPVCLEGFVLVLMALVWSRSAGGEKPRGEYLAMFAFFFISVSANIAYGSGVEIPGLHWIVSAAAPTALFVALKLITADMQRTWKRNAGSTVEVETRKPSRVRRLVDNVATLVATSQGQRGIGTGVTPPPPSLPAMPNVSSLVATSQGQAVDDANLVPPPPSLRPAASNGDPVRLLVAQHVASGGQVNDSSLTSQVAQALGVTERHARRRLTPFREGAA